MVNLRAYKYRLAPSEEQKVLLSKTFGCVRVLWNHNVEIFNQCVSIGPNPKPKTSTELRRSLVWMQEVSASAIQQKEIDFKQFKSRFFNKKLNVGRPKFKHIDQCQSFRLPNQKFKLLNHTIQLEKIGKVKIVIDRRPSETCKFMSVTVSKTKNDQYYASVLVEEEIKSELKPTGKTVGLDLGLKEFLITSDGEKIANPKFYRESQAKLRKAQKNLSRKRKGSVRYNKCKLKLARIHNKITNQRRWFHHQVSLDLVRKYDLIAFENLKVSNMLKNRRLAKAISDVGWSQFVNFVSYKARWHNKITQEVDTFFPSSKLCSHCGNKKLKLHLHERIYNCESCGFTTDRDVNAAINIKAEALKLTSQGVT